MRINYQLRELEGEQAFFFLSKAREVAKETGKEIISFGIGQPDFDTFSHIKEAAKRAIDEGKTGYTESAGIPELRETIANYLNKRYGAGVNYKNVLVTTGGKTAIFLAMVGVVQRDTEVLIVEPSYYAYGQVAKFLGARPIYVPLKWMGKDIGFELDLEEVKKRISPKTSAIVINNPDNPTGNVFEKEKIKALFDLARDHNLALISDEVYDYFVYDGDFFSVTQLGGWTENSVLIQSFSKTFSMTGWRLGYLAAKEELISLLDTMAVNLYSCAPNFVQWAGIEALNGDFSPTYKMISEFNERRKLLYNRLSEINGVEAYMPGGAFYMFPRIAQVLKSTGMSIRDFVFRLLREKGVLVLPGNSFSSHYGEEFIRLSYATKREKIERGTELIKEFVEEHKKD
ncbi:MAG: pyridoxal phosphate-dependent aminotransferase [Thermoprotei archaeon]|nr:pyridoxal phosphate-dependent aminotransferase [Thermoprotei archaeon]